MKTNLLQKNIPKGWGQVELGKIATIVRGGSPRPIEKFITDESDGLNWLKIGDIKSGAKYITHTSQKIKKEGLNKTTMVHPGDFILSNSMSFGRPYIVKIDACIHDGWLAFKEIQADLVIAEFLYYLLSSGVLQANFASLATGSGVRNLKRESVACISVILPSIKEQRKMVDILSSVDEEIQKVEEIISTTEKLKDGLVQDLFNFKNKKDIKLIPLGELGKVSMCKRIFKDQTLNTGDIPFYKIGTFGKKADAFISQELFDNYRKKFSFPKVGDVLLSASGTIGRKVKYDGEPAYFQDSNIIWLEHDESKVLNDFLFYLYETIKWETSGSTIKRLYNNAFIKEVVPVPSIDMQRKIIDVLSAADQKILLNSNLKEKLMVLKNGLMSDLLSGSKRVEI